jgi:hypothetical protein
MQVSVDMTIRQRFTRIVDDEQEAFEFGQESANIAWAYAKGFGDFELELDTGDD